MYKLLNYLKNILYYLPDKAKQYIFGNYLLLKKAI